MYALPCLEHVPLHVSPCLLHHITTFNHVADVCICSSSPQTFLFSLVALSFLEVQRLPQALGAGLPQQHACTTWLQLLTSLDALCI